MADLCESGYDFVAFGDDSMYYCAYPVRRGFTIVELLITVGIIILLASVITPALTMARDGANSAMCKSRLNSWGKAYEQYLFDHNDKFHKGDSAASRTCDDIWMKALSPYIKDRKIMFCPQATLTESEGGKLPNMAWELKTDKYNLPLHKEGLAKGSYCLNWWVNDVDGGSGVGLYWRNSQGSDVKNIPVLADGGNYTACVYSSDKDYNPSPVAINAETSMAAFSRSTNINRFLMDRHGNEINVLFMDWSVRSVPLIELWGLNWHRGYKPITRDNAQWSWPAWLTGETE